ncbi:disulfide bond formation protein B [Pseudohalocynthiibacter aestuariivivens]|jgi:disulfide bond formation protein DsbB|uniref:Putative protein-disulfide oxidoreductase DsbI n=1 Tax=Pseudohalocynthiibacter aestuariivivens TaxID=1591409 RepID=A0ABV5JG79_9RHOB|nr:MULTISPECIES: disulfide bond formation protein B [Pseudohalocynthiibacter]MBS9716198.1 disulfide bond formation protein B [Pseudohalocynthiibacter aestuariivivens]MCK0100994.1 disulfide bond formation protein B [Pseudohalocynthiibacter sp. F2068]
MTRNFLILLAAGGSLALLLGAFGFQYIGDMAPCKLCLWQRYPHGAAIFLGILALALGQRLWIALGAVAAAATGAIGIYHTGVERKWWEGPDSCTSSGVDGVSAEDLMQQILNAPFVRCDEVPWEMFTLSMATWNAIIAFGLMALWLLALRKP